MTLTYIAKLGLVTQKTNVGAQKIDGTSLVIYEIVLVNFSVKDKLRKF